MVRVPVDGKIFQFKADFTLFLSCSEIGQVRLLTMYLAILLIDHVVCTHSLYVTTITTGSGSGQWMCSFYFIVPARAIHHGLFYGCMWYHGRSFFVWICEVWFFELLSITSPGSSHSLHKGVKFIHVNHIAHRYIHCCNPLTSHLLWLHMGGPMLRLMLFTSDLDELHKSRRRKL